MLERPFPADGSLFRTSRARSAARCWTWGQGLSWFASLAFSLARLLSPAVGTVKVWGPEWSVGGETRT